MAYRWQRFDVSDDEREVKESAIVLTKIERLEMRIEHLYEELYDLDLTPQKELKILKLKLLKKIENDLEVYQEEFRFFRFNNF